MRARFHLTEKQHDALDLLESTQSRYLLLAGGSRSGKTAFLCYAVVMRALQSRSRHAILRFHFNDVKRSIGMDTLPKILDLMQSTDSSAPLYDLDRTNWVFSVHGTDGRTGRNFTSEIWLGGLDDKDRVEKILGNEYSTIYLNEASQISYHSYTTAVTRLAENAPGLARRCFIDCNPPEKSHWLYQMFVQGKVPGTLQGLAHPDRYTYLAMNPADNPHLPSDYLETLESLPDRQRRRYLLGEWLERRQGALFTRDRIERSRVGHAPDYLPSAVVAVDPAITSGDRSDETGIVTVGRSADGDYYVLRDDSVNGSPAVWSSRVRLAYRAADLDAAVYETNQGGDMVAHTIHTADPQIPCRGVHATRGKALRAEPVAALYEQGRVHHVGTFPELEDQMTEWVPGDAKSPDRLDALVWAVTYLMQGETASPYQPAFPTCASLDGTAKYSLGSAELRRPVFGCGFRR